jgi:hypothetical protein
MNAKFLAGIAALAAIKRVAGSGANLRRDAWSRVDTSFCRHDGATPRGGRAGARHRSCAWRVRATRFAYGYRHYDCHYLEPLRIQYGSFRFFRNLH